MSIGLMIVLPQKAKLMFLLHLKSKCKVSWIVELLVHYMTIRSNTIIEGLNLPWHLGSIS